MGLRVRNTRRTSPAHEPLGCSRRGYLEPEDQQDGLYHQQGGQQVRLGPEAAQVADCDANLHTQQRSVRAEERHQRHLEHALCDAKSGKQVHPLLPALLPAEVMPGIRVDASKSSVRSAACRTWVQ
jgi:hypothetical protein